MTDRPDPDPPRPTLDDLDPESATTDRLIEIMHYYPDHGEYPTVTVLLGNLPKALRLLCDHVLAGEITPLDMACQLATIIDTIENAVPDPVWPDISPHSRRH